MKFNFELECTPQEARAALGLPDLEPMQKAVLARVEAQMLDAASTLSVEGIVKMWLSVMPAASEQYARTFGAFLRSASRATNDESK